LFSTLRCYCFSTKFSTRINFLFFYKRDFFFITSYCFHFIDKICMKLTDIIKRPEMVTSSDYLSYSVIYWWKEHSIGRFFEKKI
jgi:hypothetical protein